MLIDEGSLRRHDGEWKATADRLEVSVPASIQALLAARLDQLDAPERIVGERASVEGTVFHRGAVLELCGGALREAVDPQLGSLLRRELIRPIARSSPATRRSGFGTCSSGKPPTRRYPAAQGSAPRALRGLAGAHRRRPDPRARGDPRLSP